MVEERDVLIDDRNKQRSSHLERNSRTFREIVSYESGAYSLNLTRTIFKKEIYSMKYHAKSGYFSTSQRAAISNMHRPLQRFTSVMVGSKIFCCQYLKNGSAFLVAGQDRGIRMYSKYGSLLRLYEIPGYDWAILDLIMSPNQEYMAYCSFADGVYVGRMEVDVNNREAWNCLRCGRYRHHQDRLATFSIRFNKDGMKIFCANSGGMITAFDLHKEELIINRWVHRANINSLCFVDENHNIIATVSDDSLCKIWDIRTPLVMEDPVGCFAGHLDGIIHVDAKGDERFILTSSNDQTIKVWDLRVFSPKSSHTVPSESLSRRLEYNHASVMSRSGKMGGVWVMEMVGHLVGHTSVRARFSPPHTGNRFVYTGCTRGGCLVYDVLSGMQLSMLCGHKAIVRDCMWHPSDNELLTSSWDGNFILWRNKVEELP